MSGLIVQKSRSMRIVPFADEHLPEVQGLINLHVSVVVPGWALPAAYIADHLSRNPSQPLIDPWVAERTTLCAQERGNVVAAAHILRCGTDDDVAEHYRSACDIAWLLAFPEYGEVGSALLAAALQRIEETGASQTFAWDSHLPVPLLIGVPDGWQHIEAIFRAAGFEPDEEREEALYAGHIPTLPPPDEPPLEGLTLRRTLRRRWGVSFIAALDGSEIGWCQCLTDLTEGDTLPSLSGWAELTEVYVEEVWRNHGVGRWLVGHAIQWMRLGGCDRIALSVARDDEQAGAGRFYKRFGWNAVSRFQDGWRLPLRAHPAQGEVAV